MRSSQVVTASDCQCISCNGPGFDPSIRRHSGIWGAADEAVLNIVRKKKNPPKKYIYIKSSLFFRDAEDAVHARDGYDYDGYRLRVEFPKVIIVNCNNSPCMVQSMDQITIKTPNPKKCRHFWCLIEFIDWRYSQSCWYFRPLLWTSASLTFSLVDLSLLPPFPVWISTGVCFHTLCSRGAEGRDRVVWRAYVYRSYFYTVYRYLTRFWTYKIAFSPQTKT